MLEIVINDDKRKRCKQNEQICNDISNLCKKNNMKSAEESMDRRNRSIVTKLRIYEAGST